LSTCSNKTADHPGTCLLCLSRPLCVPHLHGKTTPVQSPRQRRRAPSRRSDLGRTMSFGHIRSPKVKTLKSENLGMSNDNDPLKNWKKLRGARSRVGHDRFLLGANARFRYRFSSQSCVSPLHEQKPQYERNCTRTSPTALSITTSSPAQVGTPLLLGFGASPSLATLFGHTDGDDKRSRAACEISRRMISNSHCGVSLEPPPLPTGLRHPRSPTRLRRRATVCPRLRPSRRLVMARARPLGSGRDSGHTFLHTHTLCARSDPVRGIAQDRGMSEWLATGRS
jgi:hypothetical protein